MTPTVGRSTLGLRLVLVALGALALAGAKPPRGEIAEATALLDDWQLEDAKAIAERVLAAEPHDPEALLLAARVQHARGEHLAALSLVEAAKAGGARINDGVDALIESSAAYAAHFQSLASEHFVFRYLNKDEIVAAYAAPVLEAAYRAIGGDLELLPAERGEKIIVEIYPDARGLAGATGLTVHEIETSGTIAVCKFHRLMITSPLATADGYDWADTIAHEFTHLVISKKSHNTIPIWLHEGIAKYFESRWRGAAGTALSPYSEKLLAQAVRTKKFITFAQMHPSMAKLPSQDDAALAFAEVFTTIELLVKEHGKESVAKVLALTAGGMELEKALAKTYGTGLSGIEGAWKKYLARRPFRELPGAKPKPIKLATSESEGQTARPLEAMKDRELHDWARLGELLQLRGHTAAAVIEYEKAYHKGGSAYPTLAYRLARAYMETSRDADALGVLDQALGANPDDADLHLLAGRVRFSRKDFPGAQREFEAVRLQNPFNPEVHEALRLLYDAKGDSAAAQQEGRFLELTRKPRPTRVYELPAPRAGSAHLDIAAIPFGDIELDGTRFSAPIWSVPVDPGAHKVTMRKADGTTREESVTLAAGDEKTIVLQ